MPVVGEIKGGKELGYKDEHRRIWQLCATCGKARWVLLSAFQRGKRLSCQRCGVKLYAEKNPAWRGGRHKDHSGYVWIKLYLDDFFYPMANKYGYVMEHRLVVAKALGRCLHSWEIVHHKKEYAKDDNRYPETLQLVTDERHNQITILENKIKRLEERATLLEAENVALKAGAVREVR